MDSVLLDLDLIDLHVPVAVAYLQDPLPSGELDLLLDLRLHLVPHCQRIKAHRPGLRNRLPVQGIDVPEKLHLLFLVEPDVQFHDRVHGYLPHLPVGIRLQFHIPVH